ncbi:SRPBCC domain-containing protein [Streptomyces sp. NPDC046161]|uniref:SRPBCC domain-containing protein n=1 Tax=unclassified Streptomyces TaxID=2593676 RepID=UPI0033D5D25D
MSPVSHGTSESRGEDRRLIRFEPHLPCSYEGLWPALTTADGLRRWLGEAEVLERHLDGAVTLRPLDGGPAASGRITAWDVERVVEYTLGGLGRIRFHLEPVGTDSTVIRFLNEREGPGADPPGVLADWHQHFELLESALTGPGGTWTEGRRAELRESYARPLTRRA